MSYSSINIQGNIVSSDILTKIRQEDIRYQTPADFGLDRNTSVREEIGLAWSNAQNFWKAFKQRRDRLKETDSGTSETRQGWMIPFLRELGYDLEVGRAEILNGKSYAISHRAANKDAFPVHIVGVNQSLDKRAEGGARLSPHALTQEYLNNTEHLYAITTNGNFLRILRDATRLSRLSYLEFDLARMMEDELYAEFAILFRVMHSSRMPQKQEAGADSILEFYHQEALASGTRIRERLSKSVEKSIVLLANGLLQQPENKELQTQIAAGNICASDYYLYLLRSIYRMLFLMVIEERNLIYPANRDEALNAKRKIYYDYYSLQRLAKLAERKIYVDPRKTDLWQALLTNFKIFESAKFGSSFGIKPLGSGLFGQTAIGPLAETVLNNQTFLTLIRHLVTFEGENGQLTRVNYADLDVEEFGSVYEGLLEYDPDFTLADNRIDFGFVTGTGRSSSGSHYTPEELVKPLIKHSLDYIIADKLKAGEAEGNTRETKLAAKAQHLLSITVCDVACGSGHILLSAARRIGMELAVVRESLATKHDVEQPSPPHLRMAVRDVIRHCIYGVDLNPLAVELCKVALWLEAHNPGEPLNFLDHKIKNGNAIVGVAHITELEKNIPSEAFKALTPQEKSYEVSATHGKTTQITFASYLAKKNKGEQLAIEANSLQLKTEFDELTNNSVSASMTDYAVFKKLPESSPEEILAKQKAYKTFLNGKGFTFLKTMCDTQVAQFFILKTEENKDRFVTSNEFRQMIKGFKGWTGQKTALATSTASEKRFFHWFLEFPEVFSQGGFNCVLGNPPFLGGQKLSGNFGDDFLEYLKYEYAPIGAVDLVTYFFRRIYTLLQQGGFQSLISTNTIAQGKAREDGLDIIVQHGGSINHAVKSTKWPGVAAVEVALVTITKQKWQKPFVLSGKEVTTITPYLDNAETLGNPVQLAHNAGKSFQGHLVLSTGFMISHNEATELIELDEKNKNVVYPFLNGQDVNSDPECKSSRCVIYFDELEIDQAARFLKPFQLVQERVFPERSTKDKAKYPRMVVEWWKFWMNRQQLQLAISSLKNVIVVARVSRTLAFAIVENNQIFDEKLVVFSSSSFNFFSVLHSTVHNSWAWQYCTTMKADLNYTPTTIFETFPFPQNLTPQQEQQLETIGQTYHEHRKQLMLGMQLGLTKTYNLFHSPAIGPQSVNEADKQVAALQKHLAKIANPATGGAAGTMPFAQAVQGILKLRALHIQMDEAVLEAYGWGPSPALPKGEGVHLRHDFYEVDYLPENDRVRFTIHPDARKEVLKRLLQLNHQRFEEEVQNGLHKRAAVEAFYQQKGTPIPAGVTFSDGKKAKAEKSKKAKPEVESVYRQPGLFEEPNLFNQASAQATANIAVGSKVTIKNQEGSMFHYVILSNAVKGQFTGAYKQISSTSALADAMMGLGVGGSLEFGGVGYEVTEIE